MLKEIDDTDLVITKASVIASISKMNTGLSRSDIVTVTVRSWFSQVVGPLERGIKVAVIFKPTVVDGAIVAAVGVINDVVEAGTFAVDVSVGGTVSSQPVAENLIPSWIAPQDYDSDGKDNTIILNDTTRFESYDLSNGLSGGATAGIVLAFLALLILGVIVIWQRRVNRELRANYVPSPQKKQSSKELDSSGHQTFGQTFGPFGAEFSKPSESYPAYRGATPIDYDKDDKDEFESPTKMGSPKNLPGLLVSSPIGVFNNGHGIGEQPPGWNRHSFTTVNWPVGTEEESSTDDPDFIFGDKKQYINSNELMVDNPEEVQIKIHSPVKKTATQASIDMSLVHVDSRYDFGASDSPVKSEPSPVKSWGQKTRDAVKKQRRRSTIITAMDGPAQNYTVPTAALRKTTQRRHATVDAAVADLEDLASKTPRKATRRYSRAIEELPTPVREAVHERMREEQASQKRSSPVFVRTATKQQRSPEIIVEPPTELEKAFSKKKALRRSITRQLRTESNSSILDDAMQMLDAALNTGYSPGGGGNARRTASALSLHLSDSSNMSVSPSESRGSVETVIDAEAPNTVYTTKKKRRHSVFTEQLPTPDRNNVLRNMDQLPTPKAMNRQFTPTPRPTLTLTSPNTSPGTLAAASLLQLDRSLTTEDMDAAAANRDINGGMFYSPVREDAKTQVVKAKGMGNLNPWDDSRSDEKRPPLPTSASSYALKAPPAGYVGSTMARLSKRMSAAFGEDDKRGGSSFSLVLDDEDGNGGSMFPKRGASTFSLV